MVKRFIPLICLLLVCTALKAQTKMVLTLDEAKNYALEYNRTLQKAKIAVSEADAQLWQAIAQGLPQIDGSVDYTNFLGHEAEIRFDENAPASTIPTKPSSNAKLTVSQLLFSGSFWVGKELATLSKKLQESSITKSELSVKQDVSSAFYNILMAEQAKVILEQNLINVKDLYTKTEGMVSVGVAEETDADQLSVQVLTVQTSIKSIDRQIELAYNLLRLQLGVDANTKLELVGGFSESVKQVNVNALLGNMLNLPSNIDFQLLKQQEVIKEKQIKLEKMAYLPTIAAFYNYNYKIIKPNFDMNPPHAVGVTASIPIFSSGLRKSKVTQAKYGLQSLQLDIKQVEDQLNIQEKQLRFNLQNAHEQYTTQQKYVEVSKKVYNSFKLKFEQGVATSIDLTTANNNYLQAENNLLSAGLSLLQAEIELKNLLGTL